MTDSRGTKLKHTGTVTLDDLIEMDNGQNMYCKECGTDVSQHIIYYRNIEDDELFRWCKPCWGKR